MTTTGFPVAAEDAAAPLRPLPRSGRRSRALVGLLVVAVSATVGGWLFVSAGQRTEVLVVARDVAVGSVIGPSDVASTRVGVEARVPTIPASRSREVIGRIAAVDLRAGTLLSAAQLTTALTPGRGQQLVAAGLRRSQLPVGSLHPGDQVLVVPTPGTGAQDSGGAGGGPLGKEVPATVDQVSQPDADGIVVVNLLVAAEVGPPVAKQASLGRVALVVTTRRP